MVCPVLGSRKVFFHGFPAIVSFGLYYPMLLPTMWQPTKYRCMKI